MARLTNRALAKSTDGAALYQDHREVRSYHSETHENDRYLMNVVATEPWTAADNEQFRLRNTTPLRINHLKSSERALVGYFTKSQFSVKFSQVGAESSDAARVYQSIYDRDLRANRGKIADEWGIRTAWATGTAYCEI